MKAWLGSKNAADRVINKEYFMVTEFVNDDAGYLVWVNTHPHGYIANIDVAQQVLQYPMVHTTSHRLLSSSNVGSYTSHNYVKVCSTDLDSLEKWSQRKFNKALTKCRVCKW